MASLQQAEKECPLTKFIDSLDDEKNLNEVYIEHDLVSIESDKKEAVKLFLSKLSRNYSYMNECNSDIKIYCCAYLNHWLDKQKQSDKISDAASRVIENSWDTLKQSANSSCERKRYVESLSEKDKCIDFMVYCVNRDELKNKFEETDYADYYKGEYCSNFNEFTNKYYKQFNAESSCLDCTTHYNNYVLKLSENCTIHNIPKTFPKCDTSTNKISEDTSRKSIKNCPQSKVSFSISTLPWKYGLYGVSSLIGFLCLSVFLYKKRTHGSFISNSPRKKKKSTHTDNQHSQELMKKSNSKNKHYNFSYSLTKN
ncbi:PIR protein [Plasmodium vivax]|uniref:VIR protein n=1 Tax=Plasmodium vivax TaxID=5855 RepID=A0A565A5H8_PLAVI|nr:PIR protein [Plasmodium vivax]